MEFGRATDWHEAVLEWLRSEGQNLPLSPSEREQLLGDNADIRSEADNTRRLNLLRIDLQRYVIIDQLNLPDDPLVQRVKIEEGDLRELYIVPTPDWYLDTGHTFRLPDTVENLKSGRGYNFGNGPKDIGHHQKVIEIAANFTDCDPETTKQALILVSPTKDGPYIIIDGTHRATALYRNHLKNRPNMPWIGILISYDQFRESVFYINSELARRAMETWERWTWIDILW